ncbi:hypothetical protein TBLA_0E00750 [Henningerozyma blattae CBS 6284]|uniref:Uncharacterized protein n=1 Tax=Henningerozyma blattae (strain ATCC 34711 / CBS 6284 / DSM 70876 / NBRC 10599 / NRRL Y-10934 / UCD 77-7) TaxID=1071380 RepID=I2H434_HENB6|nr:hypothetical protein TBLA_0E00750 [Tetrapisispora blattae CBS 6284]CCH61136.1 hypothetical protein TBLA_0E00750 [Tetrapisispora blattae CBS 6284]
MEGNNAEIRINTGTGIDIDKLVEQFRELSIKKKMNENNNENINPLGMASLRSNSIPPKMNIMDDDRQYSNVIKSSKPETNDFEDSSFMQSSTKSSQTSIRNQNSIVTDQNSVIHRPDERTDDKPWANRNRQTQGSVRDELHDISGDIQEPNSMEDTFNRHSKRNVILGPIINNNPNGMTKDNSISVSNDDDMTEVSENIGNTKYQNNFDESNGLPVGSQILPDEMHKLNLPDSKMNSMPPGQQWNNKYPLYMNESNNLINSQVMTDGEFKPSFKDSKMSSIRSKSSNLRNRPSNNTTEQRIDWKMHDSSMIDSPVLLEDFQPQRKNNAITPLTTGSTLTNEENGMNNLNLKREAKNEDKDNLLEILEKEIAPLREELCLYELEYGHGLALSNDIVKRQGDKLKYLRLLFPHVDEIVLNGVDSLEDVLEGLPRRVFRLIMNDCNIIENLEKFMKCKFYDVEMIGLNNNKIDDDILYKVLNGMLHLREIELKNNCIKSCKTFQGQIKLNERMKYLERLELSNNKLQGTIDFQQWKLPHLEEVYLNNNRIETIKNINYLPKIRILEIDNNGLKKIEEQIIGEALRNLSMKDNYQLKLDRCNPFPYEGLQSLEIGNLDLVEKEFIFPANLKRLKVCGRENVRVRFPMELLVPNKLKVLHIEHFIVEELQQKCPRQIKRCLSNENFPQLEELVLRDCGLDAFVKIIEVIPNERLEVLDIRENNDLKFDYYDNEDTWVIKELVPNLKKYYR